MQQGALAPPLPPPPWTTIDLGHQMKDGRGGGVGGGDISDLVGNTPHEAKYTGEAEGAGLPRPC